VPAMPSWLLEPLWDQFAALLPDRPRYGPFSPARLPSAPGLRPGRLRETGSGPEGAGGGECAGPSPVDRRKLGMKRSLLAEGRGIPPGRAPGPANRHDSPLPATSWKPAA